jgi:hypothetical protein
MATVMTSASSVDTNRPFGIRLRQREQTYWTDLTEGQRDSCLGWLTPLSYDGKTVWGVTGCLQEYWIDELEPMIRSICSNQKNKDQIYKKDHLHPTCTSQLFLLGYANTPEAAKPTIVVLCRSGRIANATKSLLQSQNPSKS